MDAVILDLFAPGGVEPISFDPGSLAPVGEGVYRASHMAIPKAVLDEPFVHIGHNCYCCHCIYICAVTVALVATAKGTGIRRG